MDSCASALGPGEGTLAEAPKFSSVFLVLLRGVAGRIGGGSEASAFVHRFGLASGLAGLVEVARRRGWQSWLIRYPWVEREVAMAPASLFWDHTRKIEPQWFRGARRARSKGRVPLCDLV